MVATNVSNVCRGSLRTMVDWRTGGRRKAAARSGWGAWLMGSLSIRPGRTGPRR